MKRVIDIVMVLAVAFAIGLIALNSLRATQQEGEASFEVNLAYDAEETAPAKTRTRELSATAPVGWDAAAIRNGLPETAELRFTTFGGENSRLVAFAVDVDSKTLWVDRNRDRQWSDVRANCSAAIHGDQ